MNILYHHRTRGTGAEGAHIRGIVNALRKMGHDVSILSFPGADPYVMPLSTHKEKSIRENYFISILKKVSLFTKFIPEFAFEFFELLYNLMAFFRLNKIIKEEAIELIYERYSLFMFIGVWVARKQKIQIILEVNDSALVQRVRPLMFRRVAKKIEKWIFSQCSGIVFISSHFRDLVQHEYGLITKTVVSPNGVDLSIFDYEKYNKQIIKDELGLLDKVICGYVGSFTPWHGIDWFIETIAPHIKKHPSLVLLLIGDGVCYDFIEGIIEKEQVKDQIILTGSVSHSSVPKFISAMDFGILPDSNTYGSPMKLFEFMALKCGMVVPDFLPIEEVVEGRNNSWLFPRKDRKACVNMVIEVSIDLGAQARVGQNAYEYVKNHRQWKHNAEQILTLIK